MNNNNNSKNNNKRFNKQKGAKLKQAPLAKSLSYPSSYMATRVKQRERVATIAGTTGFSVVTNLAVNPGLSASFPWLSVQANNYEKYIVHSLKYTYRTLKGATQPGNVIIGFDYDTLDAAPTSAVIMTQLGVYNDGAVWDIFEVNIPCRNIEFFVRDGVTFGDLKTYDMGRIYVATEGCADTTSQGYIEVEYDISFMFKNRQVSTIANSSTVFYMMRTDGATEAVILGDNVPFRSPITNQYGITADANWNYTIPAGNWLVSINLTALTASTGVNVVYEGSTTVPITMVFTTAHTSDSVHFVFHSTGITGGFYLEQGLANCTYVSSASMLTFIPV